MPVNNECILMSCKCHLSAQTVQIEGALLNVRVMDLVPVPRGAHDPATRFNSDARDCNCQGQKMKRARATD